MRGNRQIAWTDPRRAVMRVLKHPCRTQRRADTHVRLSIFAITLASIGLIAGCSRSSPERPHASLRSASLDERYGAQPSPPQPQPRVAEAGSQITKGGGTYKLGKPYRIAGRWYFPAEDPNYDRAGIASWYGADFHGRKTANGEVYDMNALTAAHPTLPIPSYAYVTSQRTGRTVLVRINDRGPYAKDRIMDLSRRTAEVLGVAGAGISEVRIKYAGRAPLSGDDTAERRYLANQPWHTVAVASHTPRDQPRGPEWQGRMGLMR